MKTLNIATLPTKLIADINNSGLRKFDKSHAIRFIEIVKEKSHKLHNNYTSFVGIPQTFIKKTFNGKYMQWLSVLEEKKIIKIVHSYSNKAHFCKSYCLNSDYYTPSTEFAVIPFKTKSIQQA